MPGAIVIGAGPGIGVSVARRFAREGLPIGVLARSRRTVDAALSAVADANVETHGVTAAGAVAPGTAYDPDDIADHYWRLHTQPAGAWEREVVYDGRQ